MYTIKHPPLEVTRGPGNGQTVQFVIPVVMHDGLGADPDIVEPPRRVPTWVWVVSVGTMLSSLGILVLAGSSGK